MAPVAHAAPRSRKAAPPVGISGQLLKVGFRRLKQRAARNGVAADLIVAGIVFIVLGALRGEGSAVLQKAVRICLECIGIG